MWRGLAPNMSASRVTVSNLWFSPALLAWKADRRSWLNQLDFRILPDRGGTAICFTKEQKASTIQARIRLDSFSPGLELFFFFFKCISWLLSLFLRGGDQRLLEEAVQIYSTAQMQPPNWEIFTIYIIINTIWSHLSLDYRCHDGKKLAS